MTDAPAMNTDREIWREREGDFYADSIHVTAQNTIGIDCGGMVYTLPVRKWHALASASSASPVDAVRVVTGEMVNAAWNKAKTLRMTGSPPDFRLVLEAALRAALTVGTGGAKQVCQTCNGRREVGGFVNTESGYQSDPCPACCPTPVEPSTQKPEDPQWQKLRDLLGLDGWHDGVFVGSASPDQIVTHVAHIANERARLLHSSISPSPEPSVQKPVAWRWRVKGAETWFYGPTPGWVAAQQGRDDLNIEPLYASPPQAGDRGSVKALEQIAAVCADNAAATCRHDLALKFVADVAAHALSTPQPAPAAKGGE